jgi:hypothetical protein
LQAVLDFHGAFEAWKKMMVSLYTFPRRLFWRRWLPKLSKLSQYFFFDLPWELSDRTSYMANKLVFNSLSKIVTLYLKWKIIYRSQPRQSSTDLSLTGSCM